MSASRLSCTPTPTTGLNFASYEGHFFLTGATLVALDGSTTTPLLTACAVMWTLSWLPPDGDPNKDPVTMTDAKRQRILDKIRKLQTKTTSMGCTEAEALAAAQAVGRLLDEYGLTMTDVELQSTTCVEDSVFSPFVTNRHPIRYCLRALSAYCHTAHFFLQQPIDDDKTTYSVSFFRAAA